MLTVTVFNLFFRSIIHECSCKVYVFSATIFICIELFQEIRKSALILSVQIRKKGIFLGFSEPVTAAVITVAVFRVRAGIYDLVGFALIFIMLVMISCAKRGIEESKESE